MSAKQEPPYVIPARYRKMENMHIAFWLLKDLSWCLIWRWMGIAMVIPTLSIAIIIAWRTREIKAELAHNLAIALWITANSVWMISEFFHFDKMVIWGDLTGKHLALFPFITGAAILLYYYAFQRRKEIERQHPVTM